MPGLAGRAGVMGRPSHLCYGGRTSCAVRGHGLADRVDGSSRGSSAAEQRFRKPQVAGSNPAPGSNRSTAPRRCPFIALARTGHPAEPAGGVSSHRRSSAGLWRNPLLAGVAWVRALGPGLCGPGSPWGPGPCSGPRTNRRREKWAPRRGSPKGVRCTSPVHFAHTLVMRPPVFYRRAVGDQ
jgi:hypothetical protein